MQTGRFKAIVLEKAVTKNSKDNPQVEIKLDVHFTEFETTSMVYKGQLSDGAIEHTLKALVACGIQGNSVFDPVTAGQEVSVVVNEEEYEGKTRFKISWINKPLSLGTPIPDVEGRVALKKFEGALAALRQKEGMMLKNHAPQSKDEIPF